MEEGTLQLVVKTSGCEEPILYYFSHGFGEHTAQPVPADVVVRASVLSNVLEHGEGGAALPISTSAFGFWLQGSGTLIERCHACNVSEFLDDEELPSAICDVARRLTFEWATQSKDTAHENSPEAALDTLRSTLKQRVLALVPIHFVLKHATEEQQATTISETSLVTSAAGYTAHLSSQFWPAVPEVLFSAIAEASALKVDMRPVAGGEYDRWRCEWMQHIVGLPNLTKLDLTTSLNTIADLTNLVRSLLKLTSLRALDLDCSYSKLQALPQPMHATLLPAFSHIQHLSLKGIRSDFLGYNSPPQLAKDLRNLPELTSLHFNKGTLDGESILPLLLLIAGEPRDSLQDMFAREPVHGLSVADFECPSMLCNNLRELTIARQEWGTTQHPRPQPGRALAYFCSLQRLDISCKSPVPLIPGANSAAPAPGSTPVALLPRTLTHLRLQEPLRAPEKLQYLLKSHIPAGTAAGIELSMPLCASLRSLSFCLPQEFWNLSALPELFQGLSELSGLQSLSIDVKRAPSHHGCLRKPSATRLVAHVRGLLCAAVAALQSLTSLRLTLCSLDCPAALAALQQLPQLQHLHLDDSAWRSATSRGASSSVARKQLHVTGFIGKHYLTDLVRNDSLGTDAACVDHGLAAAAADTLAQLTRLTALHAFAPRLWLSCVHGEASGVTVAEALGQLAGLRTLWLQCCSDSVGALLLAGAISRLPQLTDLSLINQQLFRSHHSSIDSVDGQDVPAEECSGREVASVLARSLHKLTCLTALRLDGNDMTDDEIFEEVVRGISASGLERLCLRDTGISEEKVHALRQESIPPKAIVTLDSSIR